MEEEFKEGMSKDNLDGAKERDIEEDHDLYSPWVGVPDETSSSSKQSIRE